MAPVITKDRPDPRFFTNIIQSDDGNWSSEPMALDDMTVTMPLGQTFSVPGLRSIAQGWVNNFAQQLILTLAPLWYQNNLLFILHTETSGPEFDDATAVFQWINDVRNYSNIVNDQISVMTFDELVVFAVPNANWPVPPESLQGFPGPTGTAAPSSASVPLSTMGEPITPAGAQIGITPMMAGVAGSGESSARAGRRHRPRGSRVP
jgi:hypothetical protein